MPVVRRQLRRYIWVALFTLLGLLVGPLLTHSTVPVFGDICSAAHTLGDVPSHQPATGLMGQHCPLCVYHGASPALPGPRMATLQPPAGVAWRPSVVAATPPRRAAWLAAAPRGPPSAA